jgi:drug/metabolite transporter (DMT)-like permease
MVVAYGCANLLQSMAAVRAQPHHTMHPSLLLRLACQRVYVAGIGFQIIGFALAFLARRELPLFLVQASITAGLGVMAILGVAVLKWRLPRSEILLLGLLGFGVAGLVISAKPGVSRPIDFFGAVVLAAVFGVIALSGVFAVRLRGVPGSVALGSLAGLAFGAAAIDSRALAASHSWHAIALNPLLYLLFAHSLLGQLLLAMAMQRGSTTVAVAAMDAASTAPAAIIGLTMLGDQIWPGRQWLAAAGFTVTLVAVIGLARFAQPQAHRASVASPSAVATAATNEPVSALVPGPPVMVAVDADVAVSQGVISAPPHRAPRGSAVPFASKRAAAR